MAHPKIYIIYSSTRDRFEFNWNIHNKKREWKNTQEWRRTQEIRSQPTWNVRRCQNRNTKTKHIQKPQQQATSNNNSRKVKQNEMKCTNGRRCDRHTTHGTFQAKRFRITKRQLSNLYIRFWFCRVESGRSVYVGDVQWRNRNELCVRCTAIVKQNIVRVRTARSKQQNNESVQLLHLLAFSWFSILRYYVFLPRITRILLWNDFSSRSELFVSRFWTNIFIVRGVHTHARACTVVFARSWMSFSDAHTHTNEISTNQTICFHFQFLLSN